MTNNINHLLDFNSNTPEVEIIVHVIINDALKIFMSRLTDCRCRLTKSKSNKKFAKIKII